MHYRAPSWFDRKLMNPLITGLMTLGVSFWGSRILEVRGRKSGEPRRNPVNPLVLGAAGIWLLRAAIRSGYAIFVQQGRESFCWDRAVSTSRQPR